MLKEKIRTIKPVYLIIIPYVIMLLFIMYGMVFFYIRALGQSPVIPQELSEGLSERIIRFHILAEDDTKDNQSIKLKVKDAVIAYLNPYMKNITETAEAEQVISEQIPELERIAKSVLKQEGAAYGVSVGLERSYFPLRVYGDIALPPGEYNSLIIRLGNGEGHNWWCIVFPDLCFVDSTYTVVPDESKEKLKLLLTDEEYEAVLQTGKKTRFNFRILEFFKMLFG